MRITPINTASVYTCQNSKQQNFCSERKIINEESFQKIIKKIKLPDVKQFFTAIVDNFKKPAFEQELNEIKLLTKSLPSAAFLSLSVVHTSYIPNDLLPRSDRHFKFVAIVKNHKDKIIRPFYTFGKCLKDPDGATHALLASWKEGVSSLISPYKTV